MVEWRPDTNVSLNDWIPYEQMYMDNNPLLKEFPDETNI